MRVAVEGVLVLGSLLLAIVSSALVPFDGLHEAPWQPANAAFGVWALIFASVAVAGVVLLWPSTASRVGMQPAALVAGSLLLCSGWAFTVQHAPRVSAAFIAAAAALAVASLPALKPRACSGLDWATAFGPSLLAGWLSVATPLGLNLAAHAATGDDLPAWVLLPTASVAAAVAGCAGAPGTGMVLVWAAVFSKRGVIANAVGAIGVASVAFSMVQGLHSLSTA